MFFVGASDFLYCAEHFLKARTGVVAKAGIAGGYIFWQESEIFQRLEYAPFHEVVVGEARLCTTQARVIGAGFGRLAVPENTVTTGARHGSTTPYFVKEASATLAKMSVHFFGKADGIGAAGLHEVGKEGFWSVERIEEHISYPARGNGYQNLGNPVGVCRATGYIDYGQAAFGYIIFTQKSPLLVLMKLHTG